MFFKFLIFLDFQSIEPVARPIEIAIKNLVWMCLAQSLLDWCWINQICVLIDRTYFSTNRKSVKEFFKTWALHMFFTFSKVFKKIFSLSSIGPDSLSIFCRFPSNFFQGFCHLAPVRPFYHFSFFMHIFMHFRDIFGPSNFWGFWCLRWFLSKLINGFLLLNDVIMFLMIYFDQFGGLGKIENSRAWNS